MQQKPPYLRTRNERTRLLNRRDSLWHIGLPVGLAVAVAAALMVLAASPGFQPQGSVWADISLMFLILIAAGVGCVLLIVLIGLSVGVRTLTGEVPYYLREAQEFMQGVAVDVARYTRRLAELILSARASAAAGRKALDDLRGMFTPGRSR